MQEDKHITVGKKAMYTLIVLVVIVLLLILFLYLSRNAIFFKRGGTSGGSTQTNNGRLLSLDNSYVFASPIRAKANGEQIRITVYILDDRGIGMSGKAVSIGNGNVLQVNPVQPITDNQGRATFDIAGTGNPGVYIIQATTDGVTLTQKATVYFD